MNTKVMFSSEKDTWETPDKLFNALDKEFNFTIDLCATRQNTKHKRFYSPEQDGLAKDWNNEIGFCNPPYGREISKWVQKASEICTGTIVMLLPARTDTKWFHNYIHNKNINSEIRFIKGRIKFVGSKNSAPFPSMVVIFKGITE